MAPAAAAAARGQSTQAVRAARGPAPAVGPANRAELRPRARARLAAQSREIIQRDVRRQARSVGPCAARRGASALHRQLLHATALPRCARTVGAAREAGADGTS